MNYNMNFNPYTGQPLAYKVYHPKYGYVEPHKLPVKKLRSDVNALSSLALIMLAASVACSVIVGVLFGALGIGIDATLYPESEGIPTQIYYAMQMLFGPISTGLPFIVYLLVKNERVGQLIKTEKVGFGFAIMLVVAGAGLCLASNFPALLLGDLIETVGLEPGETVTPPVKDWFSGVVYFIGVAICPAIFEEFAFRGVILGGLKKYGKWFALVTSSIIFGLMHMNATSILFATIAGFVMGYIYLLTDNIWVGIGVHFVNNGIAVVLDIASTNLSDVLYTVLNLVVFYAPMVAALVMLVLLIVNKKLRLPEHKASEEVSAGGKFAALGSSVGFISLVVIIAIFAGLSLCGVM